MTFRVPASWVLVNEGNLSIAKSPEGDVGFVLAGYDNPSEGPAALHRADAEFATRFPVALGSQQLPLGSLPYKFVLSQSTEEKNGRLTRLSVLMGRGLKTPYLTLFAYVNVPKVSAGADSERHGRVFETIFQSFAPEG